MTTKSGNLGLGSLEKWDIATTKKFLKLYRNYRCLWDHTDAAYKDKAERQNALESIASAMNITGFDSRYVVLKVRALRSTYLYERRKVRLRLKNGEKFQTHLGWFHLADSFLRNYVVEKSYLHGDVFKDPNKDLPPPVESENFENDGEVSNVGFPKEEYAQYELYECPKSQITNYAENEDQELQLHVLEVQQQPPHEQQPQQQQLQEIQIKNPLTIKQEKIQSRKTETKKIEVPLKRIKTDSESTGIPVLEEKKFPSEEHNQQSVTTTQSQQQQSLNQISFNMIPISQQTTNSVPISVQSISNIKADVNTTSSIPDHHGGSVNLTMLQSDTVQNQNSTTIYDNSHNKASEDDEDEFDAFAKSVAMQLKKIPKADAYSLQVQFQLLLSQAKLKAMGKGTLSFDLSGFLGKH
ncbi:uncharacterized protein LOC129616223 [Condylostylus longicornis]|uniref:uncharacterized protein LOC129616223 n=1 Tax=Condylostylus longicornis TaxID=2530218 RepID=UPI00244DA8AE|nr:uncharacterized protein LOC129616223 [Condylostylus longicornis]